VVPGLASNGLLIWYTRVSYPGFRGSSTLSEADSDLRLVCLTRLSCASRFSQPPDALFRPRPFRLYFTPVTPLSFHLQRFPLFVCGRHLSIPPTPLAVCSFDESMDRGSRGYACDESVQIETVLPAFRLPILSWCSTLRGLVFPGLGLACAWPPLVGFGT